MLIKFISETEKDGEIKEQKVKGDEEITSDHEVLKTLVLSLIFEACFVN